MHWKCDETTKCDQYTYIHSFNTFYCAPQDDLVSKLVDEAEWLTENTFLTFSTRKADV